MARAMTSSPSKPAKDMPTRAKKLHESASAGLLKRFEMAEHYQRVKAKKMLHTTHNQTNKEKKKKTKSE